jgi:hypothetical protein
MNFEIDHIVLAARTLNEGAAFVRERFGFEPSPGGKHAGLGTHNLLVPLQRRRYLEIIAIDPDAPPPSRTRWFGLDDPIMQARLKEGPTLAAYVVRCTVIPEDLRFFPKLDPQPAERGDFKWTFGFPVDGIRPGRGALPYFIKWGPTSKHPCDVLPEAQFDLKTIEICLPCAPSVAFALEPLTIAELMLTDSPGFALKATLNASGKTVVLEG